jgi:hypothetical protein
MFYWSDFGCQNPPALPRLCAETIDVTRIYQHRGLAGGARGIRTAGTDLGNSQTTIRRVFRHRLAAGIANHRLTRADEHLRHCFLQALESRPCVAYEVRTLLQEPPPLILSLYAASWRSRARRGVSVPDSSTRRIAGHVRCAHIEYAVRTRGCWGSSRCMKRKAQAKRHRRLSLRLAWRQSERSARPA